MFLLSGCQDAAEAPSPRKREATARFGREDWRRALARAIVSNGCDPLFRDMFKEALVELRGTGDFDIVVVTDPLCWHCRLGHKLLSEYPEKVTAASVFPLFPRAGGPSGPTWPPGFLRTWPGEDALRAYVDFAYTELKQPKTHDLDEARILVLAQFCGALPEVAGRNHPGRAVRAAALDAHETHVVMAAELARDADLPGTPCLVAGETVLMGFGPGPWLEALDAKKMCK